MIILSIGHFPYTPGIYVSLWLQRMLASKQHILVFVPHWRGEIRRCAAIYLWSLLLLSKSLFGDKSKTMQIWAQSKQYNIFFWVRSRRDIMVSYFWVEFWSRFSYIMQHNYESSVTSKLKDISEYIYTWDIYIYYKIVQRDKLEPVKLSTSFHMNIYIFVPKH